LSRSQSRVIEIAAGSLEILTGHREDLDNPGFRNRWVSWWKENREQFPNGVRYRDGRTFDAELLIERMEHPDPWTRRTAYDELVISTGEQLPFDADGPWRVQRAHLQGWREWWAKSAERFPAGKWFLDGLPID
jgi:hypothetical protein